MNETEFNTLCTTENLKKYKNLSKNIYRETYRIEKNKESYILKINSSKTNKEFELIKKTIQTLNENNFQTPKLLFSTHQQNKSYFLFEDITETGDGRLGTGAVTTQASFGNRLSSIDKNQEQKRKIEDIIKILEKFYKITEKIENNNKNENQIITYIENNLERFSFIHKNILHKIINELKEINTNQNRLIITDINNTNFLEFKKKTYIIDFDEVCFCEIEYDIAQVFLNFILNENPKNSLEQNISELKKIITEYNKISETSNLKIINYLIISMYHDIIKYDHHQEIQEQIFKKVIFILNNKETILKHISA